MRTLLKGLNPIIFLWNLFKYFAHLEIDSPSSREYKPYDFKKNDSKYF